MLGSIFQPQPEQNFCCFFTKEEQCGHAFDSCTQKTHTDIVQNHFAVNFVSDLVRNPNFSYLRKIHFFFKHVKPQKMDSLSFSVWTFPPQYSQNLDNGGISAPQSSPSTRFLHFILDTKEDGTTCGAELLPHMKFCITCGTVQSKPTEGKDT
jgi:hypothetical protein